MAWSNAKFVSARRSVRALVTAHGCMMLRQPSAMQTAANAREEAAAALNIDLDKNRLTTDASEFVDDAKRATDCA